LNIVEKYHAGTINDFPSIFSVIFSDYSISFAPGDNAVLYVFDPTLLAQEQITVFLQVVCENSDIITLTTAAGSVHKNTKKSDTPASSGRGVVLHLSY